MQENQKAEQSGSFAPENLRGLASGEVQERVAQGKTNQAEDHSSQSVSQIIRSNVFTYFNLIFAVIAALLIAVGAFRGLTFLPVIIANILIGIAQQIYAKRVLDKLSLLDVTNYKVMRDGREENISSGDLVQDDVVLLESGQQIPADGIVIVGGLSVNEALLTGEQDEIVRKEGAELRSGSFVVSGRAWMKLMRVGSESYASQLTHKAKQVSEKPADMVRDIERIIRIFGIAIIPVGALLLYQSIGVNGTGLKTAVTSMAGALTGMIPEGMYLLATVALAMSAARLAGKQVLLHDMKSIETLARVDVLCVDKTGTITTGEMSVSAVLSPAAEGAEMALLARESESGRLLACYAGTVPDSNSTMRAIRAWCGTGASIPAEEVRPFSSKTKYSQVRTKEHLYCLGAPEYLLSADDLNAGKSFMDKKLEAGERVLVLTRDGHAVLFICLKDQIRETAGSTFRYFHERGVELKVISGDNPHTVSRIAATAGIEHADRYVDATSLTTPAMIDEAIQDYTVFGRVRPEQKREIVEALHRCGRKVAMTGDGVNDILAMKEADCSIAMGSGSDAARQAAQVVLMDSDFSHMQNIVAEGRRDVNNITRSATLFLYKNIFSLLLAVFSIMHSFTYPLDSSQVSLISLFNIGIPAFLLTLEDNQQKEEDGFLRNTMLRALPAALTSFFTIAALMQFGLLFAIPSRDISTASTYLLSLIGFMILAEITKPLNWYHVSVFIVCAIGVILACTTGFKTLFSMDAISVPAAALCAVFAIAEFTIMRWLTELIAFLRRLRRSRANRL